MSKIYKTIKQFIYLCTFLCICLFSLTLPGKAHTKTVVVLSIDGGGLRGMYPAALLAHMEKYFNEVVAQYATSPTPVYLTDVFDIFVGTSTGGLICLLLNLPQDDHFLQGEPKFLAADLPEFYHTLGKDIFSTSFTERLGRGWGLLQNAYYSEQKLESFLEEIYKEKTISQAIKDVVVTTIDNEQKMIFNLSSRRAREVKWLDIYFKDAARATSAAPTYFNPVDFKTVHGTSHQLIDGGVGINNPGLIGLQEGMLKCRKAKEEGYKKCNIVVVSLGTGHYIARGKSGWYGTLPSVNPLIANLFEIQDQLTHDTLKSYVSAHTGSRYYRVNAELPDYAASKMDLYTNMERYKEIAYETIESDPNFKAMLDYLLHAIILPKLFGDTVKEGS